MGIFCNDGLYNNDITMMMTIQNWQILCPPWLHEFSWYCKYMLHCCTKTYIVCQNIFIANCQIIDEWKCIIVMTRFLLFIHNANPFKS